VVPELSKRLGTGVEIVQRGALDGMSIELIGANAPISAESTLVSRLADGQEVAIDKGFVLPRLQQHISDLEEHGIRLILLLCTHKFDGLNSSVTLLSPASALERTVDRAGVSRLGVFTPSANQIPAQLVRWRLYSLDEVRVEAASPYLAGTAVENAATKLREAGVDFAVMDCIGYTESMRSRAREILNVPVHSAVGALAQAAAEFLASGPG
jgi:protein AroM